MMSQVAKPPSLRPPTPVSQSSASSSSSTPGQMAQQQNSASGSSTPTSSTPATVSTPTSMTVTSASLSHSAPAGLPTSSMASHLLHHPHLPYPASLPIPQQILGGPPFPHPPSAMTHPLSVSHPPHSSIASVTTTTAAASTPLSATLSGSAMTSGLNPPAMSRDGTQILHPPPPHLLTHPHLGPPHMPPLPPHMLPPSHSGLLRGASPTTTPTSSQAPPPPPSTNSTASSSASVIHKGISPQSESPTKERSDNNAYLPRSSVANTHLSGFPPTSTAYIATSMAPSSISSSSSVPHSVASMVLTNASYSSTVSLPTTTYASAGAMPMMTTQQLPQPPPGSITYPGAPKHSMWPPPR